MSETEPYEAQWHDSILRWRITSATRPDIVHVVELDSNGGIGECSCENFIFRLQPKIDEGVRCGVRCSHIIIARQALTDFMIKSLAEKATNQK